MRANTPVTEIFYANSVPIVPEKEIIRDSITSTLNQYFKSGINIAFLDGAEGTGKSTFLGQVYRHFYPNSFGVFINTVSRWTYNPDALALDLLNQYSLRLDHRDPHETTEHTPPPLLGYQLRLQKEARRKNTPFYFIIDGLSMLSTTEELARQEIIKLLPFGLPFFNFLISGPRQQFPELHRFESKELPLPPFGLEETRRFFDDLTLPENAVEQIHQICNMNPSRLTSVRRLFKESENPITDLDQLPEALPSIFELDWKKVETLSTNDSMILALAAFSQTAPTVELITLILEKPKGEVERVVNTINFLSINDQTGIVDFISEGHRKFTRKKLVREKEKVTRLTIDFLLRDPSSRDSVLNLPKYFESEGDGKALFDYLTPEHIETMVQSAHSWKVARNHTDAAFGMAKKLHMDAEMFKYGIEEAALSEFDDAESWRGIVDAYVALGRFESALNLAEKAVSAEDRLHLLCVIARAQKRQKHVVDIDLQQEVLRLARTVNHQVIGRRAIDIAADLIYVDQDAAIDFVSLGLKNERIPASSYESLARLAIGAFDASSEAGQSNDILRKLVERINDPAVKGFSSTVSLVFGKSSAAAVIMSLKDRDSIENDIPILRLWCRENAERKDALEVVNEAFDRAIKATKYTPSALDFRELSFPLQFNDNTDEVRNLVTKFSGQREILKRVGPTEEYVRFETSLAIAEVKYDPKGAGDRLIELLIYSLNIIDLSVRASCIAQIYSVALQLTSLPIKDRPALLSETKAALQQNLDAIISSTARQLQALKGSLRALGRHDLSWALILAKSLNTQERRESAIRIAIEAKASIGISLAEFEQCIDALEYYKEGENHTESTIELIDWLVRNNEPEILRRFKEQLLEHLKSVKDLSERLRGRCLLLTKMRNAGDTFSESECGALINSIKRDWGEMDASWNKSGIGYNIVVSFAEHSKELAIEMLADAESCSGPGGIECGVAASIFVSCLRLSISTFRGVLHNNQSFEDREKYIVSLIERIPSLAVQARLFSDLALIFHLSGLHRDCERIVNDLIKPRLQTLPKTETELYELVTAACCPALYVTSNLQAMDSIRKMPREQKDQSVKEIIRFLMTKCISGEPFSPPDDDDYKLVYEDIRKIVDVLGEAQSDSYLYGVIEDIVCTMSSPRNRHHISAQQKSQIASELTRIIGTALPDPDGVPHEGYQIACEAQISRLASTDKTKWQGFLERARKIPNVADSTFVLLILSPLVPNNFEITCQSVVREALALIEKIPTDIDRIVRLEMAAEKSLSFDRHIAKECLEKAMKVSFSLGDSESTSFQKQMVDLAYRIDVDFAAKLAALSDADPAKQQSKQKLSDRIEEHKLRKKMAAGESVYPRTEAEVEQFIENAEQLHGQLNAGKISPLPFDSLVDSLEVASRLTISEGLPVLFWAVKNLVKKYELSPHAYKFVTPMFDSAIIASELAARVAVKDRVRFHFEGGAFDEANEDSTILINPGEQAGARSAIIAWIAEHVTEFCWIIDPYFGPNELDWIFSIRGIQRDIPIEVLTGAKHNFDVCSGGDLQGRYLDSWKQSFPAQGAGETTIHVVGCRDTHEVPFHDRYFLTKGEGLRLGTSLGSLGVTKVSEISKVDFDQHTSLCLEYERFLLRKERIHRGNKIDYIAFSL